MDILPQTNRSGDCKKEVNSIYDAGNYTAAFEQDLIEAEKEIIICSPQITQEKIKRFTYLIQSRQEAGVRVTVITEDPESISYGNAAFFHALIDQMREVGIVGDDFLREVKTVLNESILLIEKDLVIIYNK